MKEKNLNRKNCDQPTSLHNFEDGYSIKIHCKTMIFIKLSISNCGTQFKMKVTNANNIDTNNSCLPKSDLQ